MLKLIKYELRKDMTLYIVIFSILFALELYLGGSILCKSDANVAISMILFLLCGWDYIPYDNGCCLVCQGT